MGVSIRGEKGMYQGKGLTLQIPKDKRYFPESLQREEVKPRQSKQEEAEKKKYTKKGIAEFGGDHSYVHPGWGKWGEGSRSLGK